MRTPLVSVIMPSYNSLKFIFEAIESVRNQTYGNWELLITDDYSEDETYDKLINYAEKDKRIKLFQLSQNSGPAVARNKSIKEARGEYLAFLDSDDIWLPIKLQSQINYMLNMDLSFTYTAFLRINEKGKEISSKLAMSKITTYSDLLKTCDIGCSTVILKKSYFSNLEMPIISKRQDYALWLRLLKKCEYAYGLDQVLTYYRINRNSVSSNKFKAAIFQFRVYFSIEKLGLFRSVYYMLHYIYFGIKKTYFQRT
jgi:glycosyltransferase involved in cell wall biosynthesis